MRESRILLGSYWDLRYKIYKVRGVLVPLFLGSYPSSSFIFIFIIVLSLYMPPKKNIQKVVETIVKTKSLEKQTKLFSSEVIE